MSCEVLCVTVRPPPPEERGMRGSWDSTQEGTCGRDSASPSLPSSLPTRSGRLGGLGEELPQQTPRTPPQPHWAPRGSGWVSPNLQPRA